MVSPQKLPVTTGLVISNRLLYTTHLFCIVQVHVSSPADLQIFLSFSCCIKVRFHLQ